MASVYIRPHVNYFKFFGSIPTLFFLQSLLPFPAANSSDCCTVDRYFLPKPTDPNPKYYECDHACFHLNSPVVKCVILCGKLARGSHHH